MTTRESRKHQVCEVIDLRRETIVEIGESIYVTFYRFFTTAFPTEN